jgi:hypothetical protein
MTLVEFRLICGSDRDTDQCLGHTQMSTVPVPGEVVNIDGEPYVVFERSWAVRLEETKSYVYLRVCPFQAKL